MKTEFVRAAMHSAAGQGLKFPSPEFEQHVAGYLGRIEGTAPDRTADALERIAAALERLSLNPVTLPPQPPLQYPGHYDPHYISPTYPFTNPTTWRSPSTACGTGALRGGFEPEGVTGVSVYNGLRVRDVPATTGAIPLTGFDAVADER
jgi:hypothetical protein